MMSTHTSSAPNIVKEDITLPDGQTGLAFVLSNVLSKEECEFYIAESERKGYTPALIDTGGQSQVLRTDVRNSSRCMWDSAEEAEKIWQRVKPFVPEDYRFQKKPLGLNERLRFLRYNVGEYFKPHFDGSYRRDNGEQSFITLQLYLNEGFEGGCTTFLSTKGGEDAAVVPKTGMALIFQHDLLHEGSVLKKGTKYAVRTDIMFGDSGLKSYGEY